MATRYSFSVHSVRIWCLSFFMLLTSLCVSLPAAAQVIIDLDDGYSIAFESGRLDPNSYEGEIYQAIFLQDGEELARADRVQLETDGKIDSPDFVLRRLEIDNLQAVEEGTEIAVRAVRMRNLPVGWMMQESEPAPLPTMLTEGNPLSFSIDGLEVLSPDNGFAIFSTRIATMPTRFDKLPNGTVYLQSGGFEMPFIQIIPLGDSPNAVEFSEWLHNAGLKYIELSAFSAQTNRLQDGDIITSTSTELRVPDLFGLLMRLDFAMSEANFSILSHPPVTQAQEDAYLDLLLADGRIAELLIDMRDEGIMTYLEAAEVIPPRAVLAFQLEQLASSFLPETGPTLSVPISEFLVQGGQLTLTAKPVQPVSLESLMAAIFLPDFAIQQLNIAIEHQP